MISTDLFMELNGDLVWIVDDDEIDSADKVKRSFRNDVYPDEPPTVTQEERENIKAPFPFELPLMARFSYLFRHVPKSDFEWYLIGNRRRRRMRYL
jgi:hypothetical protein